MRGGGDGEWLCCFNNGDSFGFSLVSFLGSIYLFSIFPNGDTTSVTIGEVCDEVLDSNFVSGFGISSLWSVFVLWSSVSSESESSISSSELS